MSIIVENIKRLINKDRLSKCAYLLFTLFILFSTDSLIVATNSNTSILKYSQYAILFLAFLMFLFFIIKKHRINKSTLLLSGICVTILLTMIVNSDFTGGYIFKIALLVFGYLYSRFFSLERFADSFIKIMRVIAVVSIIGFIFTDIIINKLTFLPVVSNNAGINFTTLFLANISHFVYITPRNFGPFWEPGVYQAYLFVALFYVFFVQKEAKIFDILLFSVSIVTTFSTTGLLSLAILYVAYISSKQGKKRRFVTWVVISIVFTSAIYIATNSTYAYALFSKFFTKDSSFISRWYSIEVNTFAYLKNPIFGIGITKMAAYQQSFFSTLVVLPSRPLSSFFNTNTILNHFPLFGIIFGTYFLIVLNKMVRRSINGLLPYLLTFLGFFVIYFCENFIYSLFFSMIIFLRPEQIIDKYKNPSMEHRDYTDSQKGMIS